MKIGIDIDGVILDFERQMRFYAEYYDVLENHQGKVGNEFNYLKNYEWSDEEKSKFKEEYLIKGTRECFLVPGSKIIIDLMHNAGCQIFLITARGSINKKTKEEVLNVLEKYNIYYDEIYFEVIDKTSVCKSKGIDLMIDDNPKICSELKDNKIRTIYFKDNNQKIRNNKYLKTVGNWGEIFRYLYDNGIINK